ncbi:hypothetical protein, partial [Salmonella enterica]
KCFSLIQKRQNTIRAYSDDSILFLQFAGIKKPPHEREVVIITWSYYYSFIDGDKKPEAPGTPEKYCCVRCCIDKNFPYVLPL